MAVDNKTPSVDEVFAAFDDGMHSVRQLLGSLSAAEIAQILESSPPRERAVLWQMVPQDEGGEVMHHLPEELQGDLAQQTDRPRLAAVLDGMDTDDLADLLQQLPERMMREVLELMSRHDRQRVETILHYAEDTAGGLMNTDITTVRPDLSVDTVLRYLRRHERLPDATNCIFVVDRGQHYLGRLMLADLLTAPPGTLVAGLIDDGLAPFDASESDSEVARQFQRRGLISAPVVDGGGRLVGRITVDDVVNVITQEAEHSLMSMAGLSEDEDTFAPVRRAAPRRLLWLGVNLLTALLAAAVIEQFQHVIAQVVALAVMMPVVASMGGVAGTQTLTVIIRGMAQGQIHQGNLRWLLSREFCLGAMGGLLWALLVGAGASWWFGDLRLGLILVAAMLINLLVAALSGVLVPLGLRRLQVDPALAGGVVLTTITDVAGFLAFLGLASLFYI